jgi:hypothetical protein
MALEIIPALPAGQLKHAGSKPLVNGRSVTTDGCRSFIMACKTSQHYPCHGERKSTRKIKRPRVFSSLNTLFPCQEDSPDLFPAEKLT